MRMSQDDNNAVWCCTTGGKSYTDELSAYTVPLACR